MAVLINASTSSGLVQTADTSGTVEIQSNGTTKLTVSSSGVNIGQMNGGAITADTAKAWNWNGSTTNTSIDFTSIPSWVKRITVMFNGVSTNGTSNLLIQIGAGSVVSTGYLGSGSSIAAGTAETTYTTGFGIRSSTVASTIHGAMAITLVNANTNTWAATCVASLSNAAVTFLSSGTNSLSSTLDRVRITTVNGTDTFDAGTINILYEG